MSCDFKSFSNKSCTCNIINEVTRYLILIEATSTPVFKPSDTTMSQRECGCLVVKAFDSGSGVCVPDIGKTNELPIVLVNI